MTKSTQAARPPMLPDILNLHIEHAERGRASGRFEVADRHMAPNGYMHAASVIALADSCCGMGCARALPPGAAGFTTIELKSNFLGTASVGQEVTCQARLVHGGRTTQVWDAEVSVHPGGKVIGLFRCTQMILYPKA